MDKRYGFTLIELLVVVALVMILSVVGIGSYIMATTKSKDTQRKGDLSQIAKAVEAFHNDVGRYPLSVEGEELPLCYSKVNDEVTNPTCIGNKLYATIDGTSNTYITIPVDPEPSQNYVYVSADGVSYALYAAIENSNDRDLIDDGNGGVYTYSGVSCGLASPCNYKITETGLIKSI